EGLKVQEQEVPEAERQTALAQARAHWLLALSELTGPEEGPCLVLVAGLPGSGKSTLARGLMERAGFCWVRSDQVRKELAGGAEGQAKAVEFESGIYTPEWTERTYAECLRRAGELLFEGNRVVVDATFREDRRRRDFLKAATRWGVRSVLLECRTPLPVA